MNNMKAGGIMMSNDTFKASKSFEFYMWTSVCLVSLIIVLYNFFSSIGFVLFFFLLFVTSAFFAVALIIGVVKIRYTFKGDHLLVKGITSQIEIQYSHIQHVQKQGYDAAYNLNFFTHLSTATTGKQIMIASSDFRRTHISPEREEEFISMLKTKLPDPKIFVDNKRQWKV
jgi:hypothetical protein